MRSPLSAIVLVAMMGIMLWCTAVFYPRYNKPGGNATIAWDAAGYYWYLPAIFIYNDLGKQHWADSIITKYEPGPDIKSGFGSRAENGNVVIKYASGLAVLEAPFFFIAHALAEPLGFAADGFSKPYQVAIQYGALIFAFIGLLLFRRLLLYYFSDTVVALCLFVLVVGSNYLNYSAIDGSIAHSWLFTLYAALLLCSRSFYLRPSFAKAAAIGALCGLATLIRPTDIISCIIPLLWGLESLKGRALKERMHFFRTHLPKLLLAAALAAAFISIQLIYWKLISGHWLVYSYDDQGFSWLRPHVIDYTFSARSGWITYTPVMIFALIGFFPFMRSGPNRVMVAAFSLAAFYLVTAWDIWWYAGTGGRAMIQYYPVLFFPMAALFERLRSRFRWALAAAPFLLAFIYVNVWFTYQAHAGQLYDADGGMSKEFYWRVIGRWTADKEVHKLKDGKYLFEGPLPAGARLIYSNSLHYRSASGGDSMLTMTADNRTSPDYAVAFKQGHERWLRAEATFHCGEKEPSVWNYTHFILATWKGPERLRETAVRVERFLESGETKTLSVDLKLPRNSDADSVKVHFWNVESSKPLRIEQLKVWAF